MGRPKDRKAQIALAAAELFGTRGYPAVGVDEIAGAVGISGPAVYRHFPTKYAILLHASRTLTDEILAATSGLSTLDDMLSGLAQLAVERRQAGGPYLWEGRHLDPADRAVLQAGLSTLLGRLVPLIEADQPELRARAVLSVMGSLSTHRATISPVRAREVLTGAGWILVGSPLSPTTPGWTTGPADEPDERHIDRRERLLAAALMLFHENGYHAVSMEEIGRAAGITGSSVYRHFPGKAELLAAVYHRAADRVARTTKIALDSADDPATVLGRLVDSYVDFVFGHSDLVTVYRDAYGHLPERDRHELRKAQRLHVEEWVRLVLDVRPDLGAPAARVRAHAALGLIYDLGRLHRFDRTGGYDRVVASLARCVLTAA